MEKINTLPLLIILIWCGSAANARQTGDDDALAAPETPLTLTLAECIAAAEANNLTLAEGRIAVERAHDLQSTAFDLEPTTIALSQDPTSGGGPDNALSISQTFEMPNVYAARRKALRAQTDVERGRLELSRAEMRLNVTQAYCTLAYQMERYRIISRQDSILRRFCDIARARLAAGETGRLEQINVDRLAAQNSLNRQAAEHDCAMAQRVLMLWMNSDTPVVPAQPSLTAAEIAPDVAFSPVTTAQYQLSTLELSAAERNLKVTRQGLWPSLSLSASTQLVLSGFNPYGVDRSRYSEGDFMGFEIGLNIPLAFGAQKAKVKAAKKQVAIAAISRERELKKLQYGYEAALSAYMKARNTLDYYEKGALAEADEMEHISIVAYENGAIDYVELLQNTQTVQEIRLEYAAAVDECNRAAAELRFYCGEP